MSLPSPLPSYMVTPPCMELKESSVACKAHGVFCKEPISINSQFGPFVGEIITRDELVKKEKEVDFRYAWHVSDNKTNKIVHVVNATEPQKGNWMRYVNSARFFEEQNIMSVQEGNDIYYKALKDIEPGEELLTWFEMTKTKAQKRKRESRSVSAVSVERKESLDQNSTDTAVVGNGKRQRKKKISEGMVPVDHDDVIYAASGHHHNRIKNNSSTMRRRCASVPGNKVVPPQKVDPQKKQTQTGVNKSVPNVVPVTKSLTSTSQQTVSTSQQTAPIESSELYKTLSAAPFPQPALTPALKGPKRTKSLHEIVNRLVSSKQQANGSHDTKENLTGGDKKPPVVNWLPASRPKQKRSSLVGTAEDMEEHLTTNFQFLFAVTPAHKTVPKMAPKGVRYACDVCEGQYRKAQSLKRHILREHLNHKYLSPEDIAVLNHKISMSTARIDADADPDADDLELSDSSIENSPRVKRDGKAEGSVSLQIKEEIVEEETDANAKVGEASNPADMNSGVTENSVTDGNATDSKGAEAKPKTDRAAKEKSLVSKAMEGKETFSYSGIAGVEDAFRCHLCVQLFPSVEKLKYHLTYDAHRSKGDKQFGCDRCSQRFRFRLNYQRHIESHGPQLNELSISCGICSKRFQNESNMRKHLRFHTGRNFPCKHGCDVVYPNVAKLVQHLKDVHPELPRKSQVPSIMAGQRPKGNGKRPSTNIDKYEGGSPKMQEEKVSKKMVTKDKAKKTTTKKTATMKAKKGSTCGSHGRQKTSPSSSQKFPLARPLQYKTEEEAIQEFEASHPAGWTETRGRKPQKDLAGHHCPICKKKFSTLGSMCRHRRSVHGMIKKSGKFVKVVPSSSSAASQAEEEASMGEVHGDGTVNPEAGVDRLYADIEREQAVREATEEEFDFSPPPSPNSFYENVADNVAENLSCYLDGGSDALKTASQYIKVDDYVPLDEATGIQTEKSDFDWSRYNFPRFFTPVDPVAPLSPACPPPIASLKSSLLSLGGDKSLAYPTRSAVAEREATRRGSVGTTDKTAADSSVAEERERIPRRASMGSLDKHSKGESFGITRRASMGSFENQEPTGRNADISSTDVEETPKDSGAERENTELQKTEQSDKDSENVFDNTGSAEKVDVQNNEHASSSGNVTPSGMKDTETEIDAGQKIDENICSARSEDKTESEESCNSSSAASVSCENVSESKEESSESKEESSDHLTAQSEQGADLKKTDTPVSHGNSAMECSDATPESVKAVADNSKDVSACKESCTGINHQAQTEAPLSSSMQEDTSMVQHLTETTDTETMDRTPSSSVGETSDLPVNGQLEDVSSKPAVSVRPAELNTPMTDKVAGQTLKDAGQTSKDLGSKPDHPTPTMITKSADTANVNGAEDKPSNDLSEKELEYLSKGSILYAQKNKKHCSHANDSATVPARSVESKDEENYLKMLCLSAKQICPKDVEKMNGASKPNTSAKNTLAADEAQADKTAASTESNSTVAGEIAERGETDEQTCQDTTPTQKSQETSQKEEQQTLTLDQVLAECASVDKKGKSASSSDITAEHGEDEQDSDEEHALVEVHATLKLQIFQEQVAIDRETKEICERCQPENTEFGEPSKRTAEDFAKMQFGRKRPVYCVCSLCRRYFFDVESVLKHQRKKHPSIQCSYFEVENGHSLETLFYPEISSRGVLAESCLLPPDHVNQETYTCTRCQVVIKQYSRLRAHILNCDPNTPTTPHTRKKKAKSNRHRFMEKMIPESRSQEKVSEKSSAVRNLSFRPKSQGTVIGLRANSFRSAAKNYKHLHHGIKKKEETSSVSSAPASRLPSTRVKTQNWKYSPPRFTSPSKLSTSTAKVGRPQRSRNHEMRYNPAAHVRRRDKAETVDIHQCQGCRLSFRTLSLLERHTKNCIGKDKILGQIPAANKLLNGDEAKKHSCRYCPKRFKYLRGVNNHYNSFCRVRAERVAGGGLTPEDLAHEQQLQASLQQQAWNKMENRDHTDVIQGRAHLHEDGTITHTRRKGGWPRGLKRSNKRRRNGWTCIKRRKPDGSSSESSSSPSKLNPSPNKSKSWPNTSSVRASGSATSAAMSELEAQLREPVTLEMKRKRSAKELEQPSDGQPMDKVVAAEQSHPAPSKEKKAKVDDDLSQAPVIDRMDTAPPVQPRDSKRLSPDLEPPILSPITPVTPQDAGHPKRKRKPKRKAADSAAQENEGGITKESDSVPVTTQAGEQPVRGTVNQGQKGQESGISPVAPQMKTGEGVSGPLYVLERVTNTSGSQASQLKAAPLKIPTVPPPRRSAQGASPCSGAGEKKSEQTDRSSESTGTSSNNNTVSEQKTLPTYFLLSSSSERADQSKVVNKAEQNKDGTPGQEKKVALGTSTNKPEQPKAQRKPRQRKKKGEDVPATTIRDMFKKKKSPVRIKLTNTVSNLDAGSIAKDVVSLGCPSVTGLVQTSTASANISVSLPSFKVSTSTVPSMPTTSGLVLPPGSLLAVIPNSPILLQSSPSPTLTSPSTSSMGPSPAIPIHLQKAVSEGKVLLLDPSSLPGLLASGSLPIVPSPSAACQSAATGDEQSSVKMSVTPALSSAADDRSKTLESSSKPQSVDHKELSTAQPTKPDIPNFLFDNAKTSETSTSGNPSESSPGKPVAGEDPDTQQENPAEVSSKKTVPGKTKDSNKKPKRGPPPSSHSPSGSRVKSMSMMTSPGHHTLVPFNIPSTSSATAKAKETLETAKGDSAVADTPSENDPDTKQDKTQEKEVLTDKTQLSAVSSDSSKQTVAAEESTQSTKSNSVKKSSRAKRKVPASANEEEKEAKRKKPLLADKEEKDAKSKEPVSTDKKKKGAKSKKPVSTGKEDKEPKGGDKGLPALDNTTKNGNKMSDKKAVVLNVPVVKKTGGKQSTAQTRNPARKQTNAANSGTKGKKTATTTGDALRKRTSTSPSVSKVKSLTTPDRDTKMTRKRTSAAMAVTEECPTTPSSNTKTKRKRSSAPTGKGSTTPNIDTKTKRKRTSAPSNNGTSDDDMPLSAVAAKIKDQ